MKKAIKNTHPGVLLPAIRLVKHWCASMTWNSDGTTFKKKPSSYAIEVIAIATARSETPQSGPLSLSDLVRRVVAGLGVPQRDGRGVFAMYGCIPDPVHTSNNILEEYKLHDPSRRSWWELLEKRCGSECNSLLMAFLGGK